MTDFKTEIRVFIAAVVAFIAAYGVNAFFNALLEDCTRKGQRIKARFWYMLAVLGLTVAVIFILVEYDDDDDSDNANDDSRNTGDAGGDTISSKSKLNRSPLRRKIMRKN
jgi:hypothetical protein